MCADQSPVPAREENEESAAERARRLSPIALAFLGDAVFELRVRRYLVETRHVPSARLHVACVSFVNAAAQAEAVRALLPDLTGEEAAIFRRGRNANTTHVPKNASPAEYRYATGLEALFGYLALCGREERADELFGAVVRLRARGKAAFAEADSAGE